MRNNSGGASRGCRRGLRGGGRRVVVYWHTCGSGRASVAIGENSSETVLGLGGLRYRETDLPRDAVRGAFASAKEF